MISNSEILKKFKPIYYRIGRNSFETSFDEEDVLEAMKEAQKEMVEYVLQKAAENARLTKIKERYDGVFELGIKQISKQSILSLKEEIIKEIEDGNNI